MLAGVNHCRDHASKQDFDLASMEEDLYGELLLDTLQELIKRHKKEDPTMKEA
jgi:hypothetical protein